MSCHVKTKRKFYSSADIEKTRQEFDLPKDQTFKLDTGYNRHLFSFDTTKFANEIKNHYQPIQASYYDKEGKLVSFHINCYAAIGTVDKQDLNWNQQNAFQTFIPKSVVPIDTILPLTEHLKFIRTLNDKLIDTTGFSKYDYTVIIHWGKNWRQNDSKNLIKIVNENSLLAKTKKINILYVNNDNNF